MELGVDDVQVRHYFMTFTNIYYFLAILLLKDLVHTSEPNKAKALQQLWCVCLMENMQQIRRWWCLVLLQNFPMPSEEDRLQERKRRREQKGKQDLEVIPPKRFRLPESVCEASAEAENRPEQGTGNRESPLLKNTFEAARWCGTRSFKGKLSLPQVITMDKEASLRAVQMLHMCDGLDDDDEELQDEGELPICTWFAISRPGYLRRMENTSRCRMITAAWFLERLWIQRLLRITHPCPIGLLDAALNRSPFLLTDPLSCSPHTPSPGPSHLDTPALTCPPSFLWFPNSQCCAPVSRSPLDLPVCLPFPFTINIIFFTIIL
ncbi:uncharacterized protein [Nothobranchius furzeri]|uniref:uncharacterized protein isoform X2 n=1 Tax=Nothobranchius furzeri TaxID=105023 RepID=UPI003904BDCD